jgi:hypothetical protein
MTNEEIRKQLEKQLQLLSELSEKEELTIADRLAISAEIRAICRQVFEWTNAVYRSDDSTDYLLTK